MKNGLKIYACSGLGSGCRGVGTAKEKFDYWRDNTETISNTRAVNGLLAEINLLFSQLRFKEMSAIEVLYALDLIDLYVVCLQAAESYHGEDLTRAGYVIAGMVAAGEFEYDSFDNDERDRNLDRLIDLFSERQMSGEYQTLVSPFTDWFHQNVTTQDYCGLGSAAQKRVRASIQKSVSGIGTTTSDDPADWLYGAGDYYLYLYMDYSRANKIGSAIGRKWKKQKEVLEYTHKGYDQLYPSPSSVDKVISAGITDSLERTPQAAIKELTGQTGNKGIGEIIAILTAIAGLISVIITLLQLIFNFVVQLVAVKFSDPVGAGSACPNPDDDAAFAEARKTLSGKGESDQNKKMIKYGIIGVGVAYILSKIRN